MNDRLPPIETDPLGAIRAELISAAWRRKAVRDRRRRATTTLSTALVTLVCAAGGAAAIGVDVPVVGDALKDFASVRQPVEDAAEGPQGHPRYRFGLADVKPGPGSIGDRLTYGTGSGTVAMAPYLNVRGEVCVASAYPNGRTNVNGCQPRPVLDERLGQAAVYPAAVIGEATSVVLLGYVGTNVDRVHVDGPSGRLSVRLGPTWTPDVPGAKPLRVFAAVSRTSDGPGGARLLDIRRYDVSVRLGDGRTITVHR